MGYVWTVIHIAMIVRAQLPRNEPLYHNMANGSIEPVRYHTLDHFFEIFENGCYFFANETPDKPTKGQP